MAFLEEIKKKIEEALPGAEVRVLDTSAGHEEHGATGAHVGVRVVYKGFEGKTRIEQHQMVYAALKDEMHEKVHALQIITKVE